MKKLLYGLILAHVLVINAMQDKEIARKKFFATASLALADASSLPTGFVMRAAQQTHAVTAPAIAAGIALAANTTNSALHLASDISEKITTRIAALLNRLKTDIQAAFASNDNNNNNNANNAEDLHIWEDIAVDPIVCDFLTRKIENAAQANDDWQDLYHDKETIQMLITQFNTKRARIEAIRPARIKDASQALAEAQKSLPENLQSIINPDLDGLDAIKTLEAISSTYTCYMERASENFEQCFIKQTINDNLSKCDLQNPHAIYPYLRKPDEDQVIPSHAECLKRLAEKKAIATAANDQTDLMRIRQIAYIVGDPFRKEAFEAYISGGQNALKSFQVDPLRIVELVTCRNNIGIAKGEIEGVDKQLKAVDAQVEKLTKHLATLE